MCGGGGGIIGAIENLGRSISDGLDHLGKEIDKEVIQPVFGAIEHVGNEVGQVISRVDWAETGRNLFNQLQVAFWSAAHNPINDTYGNDSDEDGFYRDEENYRQSLIEDAYKQMADGISRTWSTIREKFGDLSQGMSDLNKRLTDRYHERMDYLENQIKNFGTSDINTHEKVKQLVDVQLVELEKDFNQILLEASAAGAISATAKPGTAAAQAGHFVTADGYTINTQTDTGHKYDWSVSTNTLNKNNLLDFTWEKMDDGNFQRIDYDQDNSKPWTVLIEKFSPSGGRYAETIFFDDGSRRESHFDDANTAPWFDFNDNYDVNGKPDYEWVNERTGRKYFWDFDQNNEYDWQNLFRHYDEQGRIFRTYYDYDDGRKVDVWFNWDESAPYTQQIISTRADGSIDFVQTDLRDGTHKSSTYGTATSTLYSKEIVYDASYQLLRMETTYSDGRTISTLNAASSVSFDGDRYADLLWQHRDGSLVIWNMGETGVSKVGSLDANPGASWHALAHADFDGDGRADVVWQSDSGQAAVWTINDKAITGAAAIGPNPGPSWKIAAAKDFDGDGSVDLLWQNVTGQASIWSLKGLQVTNAAVIDSSPGSSWRIVDSFDFSGDGRSDILWQNADGQVVIWTMSGAGVTGTAVVGGNPGASWHLKAAADFNLDGHADLLFQHDTGVVAVWQMDGTTVSKVGVLANPGREWQAERAADYNGDGKSDLILRHKDGAVAAWMIDGLSIEGVTTIANPGTDWHLI